MISYSLPWITTLYLQICSSGKQTLLTYTRESHWAKPLSSQTWTAPAKPRSGTDARTVWHLNLTQAFQGLPELSRPAPPPEWFLTSPVQAHAESCLPPTATTLNVLEPRQGPCSPLSFLPELVLRLLAWLYSNYGCIETGGDSCQEGQQQIPCALTDSRGHGHLFKLQIKTSGCQGPGEGLSHRPARSNTNALGKRQPGPGHNHGSCAEKVGTMHGLGLRGANFQSGVVSLLV